MTIPLLVAVVLAAQPATAPKPSGPSAKSAAPAKSSAPAKPSAKAAARSVPVDLDAASIEYRYKERRTVMTGDPLVTLTREDATLVCRRLVAEMDEAGQVARATCEGDVKLTRGDRVVTCATATFENASGTVTCDGTPELRDGASIVHGERLVYNLDEDRVMLTRARGTVMQSSGADLPLGRAKR